MTTITETFITWLKDREGKHLEFKEAKTRYDIDELTRYCVALANENGGKLILGVSDKIPRQVVGTDAFKDVARVESTLVERLRLRIEIEEFYYQDERLLIFHVYPRPLGMPVHYRGAYWMRSGDSLVPMTPEVLRRILDEAGPDFSAEPCLAASIESLAQEAIEEFRRRWIQKSKNPKLAGLSHKQLLDDAELLVDGKVTYAALILLGTGAALSRYLAQAETIFEYRPTDASGPAAQRLEFRKGFFLFYEKLWEAINARNDIQHFREGLFVWDIPTFHETVVREALLNAISHRDYRQAGSIFVCQFPRKLTIVSPGGFPPGINQENMLWRQLPRNRRIAETFGKCGLVERSGQGLNLIFEETIRQNKPLPDFGGTDDYQVSITLFGEVRDPMFIGFLERIGEKTLRTFSTDHFLVLDLVHQEKRIPDRFQNVVRELLEVGAIDRIGKGKGVRYLLPQKFYAMAGKKGLYTWRRGLDRATNKELLLKHLERNRKEGARFAELLQVLPSLSRGSVQKMLQELKAEGKAVLQGRTKGGVWFPAD